MIENRPKSADEQLKLGEFYLAQNNTNAALDYLQITIEINSKDKKSNANHGAIYFQTGDVKRAKADLGAVYFETGDVKKARELWVEIIADENASVEDGGLYLKTLSKYGLQTESREKLLPIVVKKLKKNDKGDDDYYRNEKQKLPENLENLIRKMSESFDSEVLKANY